MEIYKDKDLTIYYYRNRRDLETWKNLFDQLQIDITKLVGPENPVKLCPRNGDYHVLLLDTGNREADLEKLDANLKKSNLSYILLGYLK